MLLLDGELRCSLRRSGITEADEAEAFGLAVPVAHDGSVLDLAEVREQFFELLLAEVLREVLHVHVVEGALGGLVTTTLVLQNGQDSLSALRPIPRKVVLVHFLDGFLSLLDLAVLYVAVAQELVVRADADLAADDLAKGAELGIQVSMVPLEFLEAFDEDRCALHVSASGFSSHGVQVVGQGATHQSSLDAREPEVLNGLLRILDGLKLDKSVVEVLEKRPATCKLVNRTYLLMQIVHGPMLRS